MSIVVDPGIMHDDGGRDARRYHDRVRGQIAQRLREQIGDEQLITAGPERRIRVPIKDEREWRFIFDRGQQEGVGQSQEGKPGDLLRPGGQPGPGGDKGQGGDGDGTVEYEVELDMDEVEQHLFEQLGLPRLAPRGRQQTVSDAIVFDDRAKKGPLLDKKATLRANLRRNASRGRAGLHDFEREDLRYLTYREQQKPVTQAVVFFLMDVSSSMGTFEKKVSLLFFWWAARFLRRRYPNLEIVFIAHHTEANECTEEQFFSRVESGGTRCSSAYELAQSIQRNRYPANDWNIFVCHCSDGDNYTDDNERLLQAVTELAQVANLIGFVQIDRTKRYHWSGDHVLEVLSNAEVPRLVSTGVSADTEIWAALKTIFSPEAEDLAS